MELRSQDKDLSIPNSFCYHPAQPPPSKLSSVSASVISSTERTTENHKGISILNQTLDHPQLLHQHHHSNPTRPQRDPDPKIPNPNPPLPPPTTSTTTTNINSAPPIRYRECLKNHAATIGGRVFDGCGEFMSGGAEGTPEALKCAACDCHRNFHRKEVEGESQTGPNSSHTHNPTINHSPKIKIHPTLVPPPFPPPPPSHHHKYYQSRHHHHHRGFSTGPIPPVMSGFGGNNRASAGSSSEDLPPPPSFSGSKKRFRTKFTQAQKGKMQEFGEKLGWKIQKQDEEQVQQFCAEVGVKRQVFKVWMHNNKQAIKKKHM